MFSRRRMLSTSAVGAVAGALALAGCAEVTNPTTGVVSFQLTPAVTDFIQSAVAAAAKYIPTIESIAATAASLFGPVYGGLVTAGSAALNQVIAVLTNAANTLAPPAAAAMHARLRSAAGPSSAVLIGITPGNVEVTGYRVP
jgi:hypothetical protein